MKKWLSISGIVLLSLFTVNALIQKSYRDSQSEAVYAAAVRDIAMPAPGPDSHAQYTVFFVRINREDPPPSFFDKLKGSPFSVRPGSQGKRDPASFSHQDALDSATGEKGMAINLGRIQWQGRSQAIVPASDGAYSMELTGNQWHLKYKMEMVVPLL